jgi:hypothetical protein
LAYERKADLTNLGGESGAWAVIDVLPACPIITSPVAVAATGRSKPQIDLAIRRLTEAGVLEPLSDARRNRSWEANGLLELLNAIESEPG